MGGTTTADSVEHRVQWPVPPQNGYTVDDLFTLPDLPPHTELIDGSLVFVSPQRRFHASVIGLLVGGLCTGLPAAFRVGRKMTVILDTRNGPEPDVSVVRAEAITGPDQTSCEAKDVVLAVEVVSPDSESRDRTTKPRHRPDRRRRPLRGHLGMSCAATSLLRPARFGRLCARYALSLISARQPWHPFAPLLALGFRLVCG